MKNYTPAFSLLFVLFFITNILSAQPAWERLNPSIDGRNNYPIEFINSNTGFSVINEHEKFIIKTTNAGFTWNYINHPDISGRPLFFNIKPNGDIYLITITGYLKSTDEGLTWSLNSFNLSGIDESNISNFIFPDVSNWFMLEKIPGQQSDIRKVRKSNDDGQTWSVIQGLDSVVSIDAPSPTKLVAFYITKIPTFTVPIFKLKISEDAGLTWDTVPNPTSYLIATSGFNPMVKFIDNLTGFIVLKNSKILKTSNGGYEWEYVQTENFGNFNFVDKISVKGNSLALLSLNGRILISHDSGNNWIYPGYLYFQAFDFSIRTPENIFSSGIDGIVYWNNQSNSWNRYHDSFYGNYFSLKYLKSGKLLLGGFGIKSSTDFGSSWTDVVSGPPHPYFISIKEFEDGTIYAGGDHFYRSTDQGNSFEHLQSLTNSTKVNGYDFIDKNVGMFVGRYGRVTITVNGGLSIEEIHGDNLYFGHLFGVTAANENRFIAISRNKLFITDNLTTSWTTKTLNEIHYYQKIVKAKNGNLFIIGSMGYYGDGVLLKSEDNGNTWEEIQTQLSTGGIPEMFTSIFTGDDDEIYLATWDDNFLKSFDGGETWLNPESKIMYSEDVMAMDFPNRDTGFAIGYQGTLTMTTSGGQISVEPIQNFVPETFLLHQNYPNPFNPSTKITFDLSEDTRVSLKVFDITGREIATLLNHEFISTGRYTFDFNGARFSSGVYFYRLEAGDYIQSKKMMLIK